MNTEHTIYKLVELTGSSDESIEDAVNMAIKRASATLKRLCWFQIAETRGTFESGEVKHWQVTVKLGFAVEE